MKRMSISAIIAVITLSFVSQPLSAFNYNSDQNIIFYDRDAQGVCPIAQGAGEGQLGTDASLQGALKGAEKHKSLYQKVGTLKDVPWQMLAAIHYRETTYGTVNPSNGQGIFQFYSLAQQGAKFPPGQVSSEEFERQLGLLADLLKTTYSQTPIKDLKAKNISAADSDARKVKDIFFSYNGRAPQYADQAKKLGFDPATDPFEGSPYVLNLADEKHTPKTNPKGWGGFYADGKFGYYPDYNSSQAGAFVVYAALGGGTQSAGGSCSAISATGNGIVDAARTELAKKVVEIPAGCDSGNTSRKGDCGPEVNKYTDSHLEYWCADFVSWVYKTAGAPFTGGSNGWRIASTGSIRSWFTENGQYFKRSETSTPMPGDVIIFVNASGGTYHTGIVDTVKGDSITSIEGNTSTDFTDNGDGVGSHTYNWKTASKIDGFGRLAN